MISLILLIVALILFVMSTFNWPASKINLQSAGLCFVVLSWLIGHPGWKVLS